MELEAGNGWTRDVSVSGVYFETEQSFSVGAPITFSMVLAHANPDVPLRVQCQGHIVRVERRDGRIGIAATVTSVRFGEDEKEAPPC